MNPELIADYACQIGENPLWHPLERRLYWTDIPAGALYRYDPAAGTHEQCYQGAPVGGFTIQADGSLLLFMARGAIARWRQGRLETIIAEIPAEVDGRFNDVIADPLGRVYCGTLSTPPGARPGRLYRLDTDGALHQVADGVGISNGMGFTPDRRGLYYTDSLARRIDRFDYDPSSGALTDRRAWLHTPPGAGEPDGLTVDALGCVWSARWDDSALYRYAPDGTEIQRIVFPARKVSSVAFGGDDLQEMYVTTALAGGSKAEEGPGAGALFRLRPGVAGLPEYFSRVLI
jgi:D-xylonolactonase